MNQWSNDSDKPCGSAFSGREKREEKNGAGSQQNTAGRLGAVGYGAELIVMLAPAKFKIYGAKTWYLDVMSHGVDLSIQKQIYFARGLFVKIFREKD